jgi:hypothetical protein
MVTKHVFWVKYFGKSVFGHFFCPFLIFPKYFPSKKQGSLLQPVEKKFSQKFGTPLHNVGRRTYPRQTGLVYSHILQYLICWHLS